MNKVILYGNVGADPEIRSIQSGDKVANLRLCTSEKWTDKGSGEKKERSEWHRVTVWGPLVNVVERYVTKGTKLLVEGKIQTRKWQDQTGQDRYSTEIVLQGYNATLTLCGSPQKRDEGVDQSEPQGAVTYGDHRGGAPSKPKPSLSEEMGDESIPF